MHVIEAATEIFTEGVVAEKKPFCMKMSVASRYIKSFVEKELLGKAIMENKADIKIAHEWKIF